MRRQSTASPTGYPAAGTIDGVSGNHVLFAPPFVSTEADLEEITALFARSLDETLSHPEISAMIATKQADPRAADLVSAT